MSSGNIFLDEPAHTRRSLLRFSIPRPCCSAAVPQCGSWENRGLTLGFSRNEGMDKKVETTIGLYRVGLIHRFAGFVMQYQCSRLEISFLL